jgi:DNA-binding MarR family transcriptional regulator
MSVLAFRSLGRSGDSAEIKAALETRAFFISRVSTLNVLLKRRAAIYAKHTFGFALIEWRIITLLPTVQPISIRQLALEVLIDAAQVSRGVARLEKRRLVTRERNAADNRAMLITLTKQGAALSTEMCRASLERNDQLLAENSAKDIQFLNSALDSLIARARILVAQDTAAATR